MIKMLVTAVAEAHRQFNRKKQAFLCYICER